MGDVVCIEGEVSSPTELPFARIEEVHPGKDGKVQLVTIRTTKGIYKLPIAKVVPLLQKDAGGMFGNERYGHVRKIFHLYLSCEISHSFLLREFFHLYVKPNLLFIR